MKIFKERHNQVGGVASVRLQHNQRYTHGEAGQDLQWEFGARGQSQIAAVNDLNVIVGKYNGSEGQSGTDRQPDEFVGEICPQKRRDQNGNHDQHAAHGGRSSFLGVRLGALLADVLSTLELAQLTDDRRASNQSHEQGGETGKVLAGAQIARNTQRKKMRLKNLIEQPVEQKFLRLFLPS